MTLQQRFLGSLWGSLVGDALGVPVEFQDRDTRRTDPVTGMRGHGTHNQPAGTWSDDGALLLCAVESLTQKGFDIQDMGERFVQWYEEGHWAAGGVVFDVGNTTVSALNRISDHIPAEGAGGTRLQDNGNGSLMRILPVALASLHEPDVVFLDRLRRASAITHGHALAQMACVFHGLVVKALAEGLEPRAAMTQAAASFRALDGHVASSAEFRDLLSPTLATAPESQIRSGGYVMETLKASLWCLLTTSNWTDCVLKAVNLGSDTDTTGSVAGGLAGVCYGDASIPQEWLAALPEQTAVRGLIDAFTAKIIA